VLIPLSPPDFPHVAFHQEGQYELALLRLFATAESENNQAPCKQGTSTRFAVYHDRRMTRQAIVAVFASYLLLAAQILGLHWHDGADRVNHHSGEHSHQGAVELAVELESTHLETHYISGDFDLESELAAGGNAPLIKILIFVLVLFPALATGQSSARSHHPPFRPPRGRFNPFELPPSHAPPHLI